MSGFPTDDKAHFKMFRGYFSGLVWLSGYTVLYIPSQYFEFVVHDVVQIHRYQTLYHTHTKSYSFTENFEGIIIWYRLLQCQVNFQSSKGEDPTYLTGNYYEGLALSVMYLTEKGQYSVVGKGNS
uniref:Uncharacterized protein n=1 Tax=Megaselia scalaris TaxID=36166 RepID=T1GPG1_MEGSC